jgi:hypothetical protein
MRRIDWDPGVEKRRALVRILTADHDGLGIESRRFKAGQQILCGNFLNVAALERFEFGREEMLTRAAP